ncbi:pre-mRNA-splicing factor CWC25 homolog [Centruroides sculpturatus]|uniref:pre-mRNA-splicing factor CWC25 homolog n=1 Tax=Centruroides sculpturatus TaxID=218467 RepID=UPI000C6E89E9|nr:pre-mRNA-splicing factor CWC25 homolog [Centruroides sculpturatus]
MGGGDLNLKKSWHPSTLRNIERVWKAEQKHEAEQKKIEQLQRELAEERAKEEMQHYAEEKGAVQKREEKLDWMYQGPAALVDREQYLTGRQIDKTFEILQHQEQDDIPSDNESCIGSIFARTSSNAPVDIANKIREDPLFLIRKQEEEKQKKLLNNPVKLKQLQEMLRNSLSEDKLKKKHKKKIDKKLKKKKSHKKSHKHSKDEKTSSKRKDVRRYGSSESDSGSDSDVKPQYKYRRTEKYNRREPSRSRDNYYKRESDEPSKKKRITEEEMERKRREMMEDAQWRQQQLKKNIHHYKEEDLKEDLEVEKIKDKDFIRPMLSKAADTGTVEARIKRNIYNIQRSKSCMDSNFARR